MVSVVECTGLWEGGLGKKGGGGEIKIKKKKKEIIFLGFSTISALVILDISTTQCNIEYYCYFFSPQQQLMFSLAAAQQTTEYFLAVWLTWAPRACHSRLVFS